MPGDRETSDRETGGLNQRGNDALWSREAAREINLGARDRRPGAWKPGARWLSRSSDRQARLWLTNLGEVIGKSISVGSGSADENRPRFGGRKWLPVWRFLDGFGYGYEG